MWKRFDLETFRLRQLARELARQLAGLTYEPEVGWPFLNPSIIGLIFTCAAYNCSEIPRAHVNVRNCVSVLWKRFDQETFRLRQLARKLAGLTYDRKFVKHCFVLVYLNWLATVQSPYVFHSCRHMQTLGIASSAVKTVRSGNISFAPVGARIGAQIGWTKIWAGSWLTIP